MAEEYTDDTMNNNMYTAEKILKSIKTHNRTSKVSQTSISQNITRAINNGNMSLDIDSSTPKVMISYWSHFSINSLNRNLFQPNYRTVSNLYLY